MDICYKLILEDDFDWGHLETSKDERLKEFESKFGRFIERIAQWYGYVVYDIDKASPWLEERLKLIREYADGAYYIADHGIGITKLNLPYRKPSDQAYLDNIDSRRTSEEKKASEDYIRHKLDTDPKYKELT